MGLDRCVCEMLHNVVIQEEKWPHAIKKPEILIRCVLGLFDKFLISNS